MTRRLGRLGISAGVLTLAVAGGVLRTHSSHAAYSVCRTDPTVALSNGQTVTMEADISTDSTQVNRVDYYLHVPWGVSVTGIAYDDAGNKEALHVYADRGSGRYDVAINASVSGWRAQVTAFATVSGYGTQSATGQSGELVRISFGGNGGSYGGD